MKRLVLTTAPAVAFLFPGTLLAQAAADSNVPSVSQAARFYRFDFTVKQVEAGRIISSRSYSAVVLGGQKTMIRSGTRIPFKRGQSVEYLDVGLNIDCQNTVERDGQLRFHVKAEISSVAPGNENSGGELPALRQNQWESDVNVSLRKAEVIFSSDDLASKQTTQLEVLATLIK